MYSVDGDFGQVRLISQLPSAKDPAGLFSFTTAGWHRCNDKYHMHRPYAPTDYLLFVTVQGCGCLQFGGNEYCLPAGSVALAPRNVPHTYFTPKGGFWEFYWIHPGGSAAEHLLDTICSAGKPVVTGADTAKLSLCFEYLITIYHERPANYLLQSSREISNLLHLAGLELMLEKAKERQNLSGRVITYIEQHCTEQITIESVAKALYLSTSHLIREFRKETGSTPHAYLMECRIANAEQLLRHTATSIEEIARSTGFCSSSHLISAFRRLRGMTPAAYRRKTGE